jgi:hypothetical protein
VVVLVAAMLVAVPVAVPFFLPSAPAALITLVAARIFDVLPAPVTNGRDAR